MRVEELEKARDLQRITWLNQKRVAMSTAQRGLVGWFFICLTPSNVCFIRSFLCGAARQWSVTCNRPLHRIVTNGPKADIQGSGRLLPIQLLSFSNLTLAQCFFFFFVIRSKCVSPIVKSPLQTTAHPRLRLPPISAKPKRGLQLSL